jgi:hypothetical protein
VRTFIVPYASRIENGLPCPDARGRCDAAIKIARKTKGAIVLGVGSPNGEQPSPYSEAMSKYLIEQGWPKERIIVNSTGFGTIGESRAAYETIMREGDGEIIAVSAWYHIIRVWLIWAITRKRLVRVRASWKTYPWTNPFRELIMCPLTLYKILKSARNRPGA